MTRSVPNLVTAPAGPVLQLEAALPERRADIEIWLRRQWPVTPAQFYASVDLRKVGFTLAAAREVAALDTMGGGTRETQPPRRIRGGTPSSKADRARSARRMQ